MWWNFCTFVVDNKNPPTTVEECKSGELQINCDDKSTARLCRFARRRTISGITKRLPFEDIDFYDLFRITFENCELVPLRRNMNARGNRKQDSFSVVLLSRIDH